MRKVASIAAVLLLIAVAAFAAAYYYVVIEDYADGSSRSYDVITAEAPEAPPEAPCRSSIHYEPSWCTSSGNCLARAAAPPAIQRCPVGGGPYEWDQ